jgi:hypothetical protein
MRVLARANSKSTPYQQSRCAITRPECERMPPVRGRKPLRAGSTLASRRFFKMKMVTDSRLIELGVRQIGE